MNRQLSFVSGAWNDYMDWQSKDKKSLKRINDLLKDIGRHPFTGIGKPEPLRNNNQGYWSRRIDETNRVVYKVENNQIIIIQCGGHYDDN